MGEHVITHDCGQCPRYEADGAMTASLAPRKLILINRQSPGDVLVMTAALEALHRQHPGRFITAVETSANAIFEHNPWVQPRDASMDGAQQVPMCYPAIHRSGSETISFMGAYVEMLGTFLDVPLRLDRNRPALYLSEEEKGWMSQVQEITHEPTKFWLVNAGNKADFDLKRWGVENYQMVVDRLQGEVQFVQIGSVEHEHERLRGVIDLVGRTDTRQLIRLAYHCQGGLGPSTFLQHLCAAWEKPYCCILGGREPSTWVGQYPLQYTFHTIGQLPCCRQGACWKSRVVARGDGSEQDKSLCQRPHLGLSKPVGECMMLIRPETVAETIWQLAHGAEQGDA